MTITIEAALDTARALATATVSVGVVRQICYELMGRTNEWQRAVDMARDYPDDGAIELVSSVQPGMFVLSDDGPLRIIRVLNGGLSLHLESDRSPQGQYRNYLCPTSPVVVKA